MSFTDLQGTTKASSRELQRASGNYKELQLAKGSCRELQKTTVELRGNPWNFRELHWAKVSSKKLYSLYLQGAPVRATMDLRGTPWSYMDLLGAKGSCKELQGTTTSCRDDERSFRELQVAKGSYRKLR